MGGGAFKQAVATGQPSLSTPRMTPTEYVLLKEIYTARIQAYFSGSAKVAVLKEAPEKSSYGDLDIFVGSDDEIDMLDLANAIGATGVITRGPGKCSVGVPRDGSPSPQPTVAYEMVNTNCSGSSTPGDLTEEEYAQIDIGVIPIEEVEWYIFYSAYGDLNGLLGHIVTHLGFTITDRGLWLRMKELDAAKSIERANVADDLGKMFLSSDPRAVMRFLGLSEERWQAGFATLDDLYRWLGACRLLHPSSIKLRRDKSHARKREEERDVYRKFFFEWLPSKMPGMDLTFEVEKDEQAREIATLRQKYLDEALEFFDKRSLYEEMQRKLVHTVDTAVASNLLRPMIVKYSGARANKLGELLRAFRRFTVFGDDGIPVLSKVSHTDDQSQLDKFLNDTSTAFQDEGAVDEFVATNWEMAKESERSRAKKTLIVGEAASNEPGGL